MTDLETSLSAVGYAKVIVALKPQMALAQAGPAESDLERHFIVPDDTQAERLAFAAARASNTSPRRAQASVKRKVKVYPHLGLAIGYVDTSGAASLKADARVETVVPAPELSLVRPVAVADVAAPKVTPTWGLKRLRVPELWSAGITGKGVLVGHLDTGIDATHPALQSAIEEFAEFDMTGERVPNARPRDSDQSTPAHGTHTAGTIAGRPTAKGVIGVAPDAKLISGMVIEGGQVIDRILAGMEFVLSKGARILSMSLGLRGFTPAFQVVVDALRSNNVLPAFAVGNEGALQSRSPGNYANVLSIGAMSDKDIVADFSGSQTFQRAVNPLVPELVAPGVDVISCGPNKRYVKMSGTSMATPHVAGLAALLLQGKPTATADDLEQAIVSSCKLPSGMLQERGNHGVPDAVVAFTSLTGHPPAAPAPAGATPRKTARKMPRKPPVRGRKPKRGAAAKRPAPTRRRKAAGRRSR